MSGNWGLAGLTGLAGLLGVAKDISNGVKWIHMCILRRVTIFPQVTSKRTYNIKADSENGHIRAGLTIQNNTGKTATVHNIHYIEGGAEVLAEQYKTSVKHAKPHTSYSQASLHNVLTAGAKIELRIRIPVAITVIYVSYTVEGKSKPKKTKLNLVPYLK